jgi:hypothetical protein
VGRPHIGVFKIINEIKKEQNQVELNIESILRGAPRPARRRKDRERENRIQTVYNDYENRELIEYLRGIAHNLSF